MKDKISKILDFLRQIFEPKYKIKFVAKNGIKGKITCNYGDKDEFFYATAQFFSMIGAEEEPYIPEELQE